MASPARTVSWRSNLATTRRFLRANRSSVHRLPCEPHHPRLPIWPPSPALSPIAALLLRRLPLELSVVANSEEALSNQVISHLPRWGRRKLRQAQWVRTTSPLALWVFHKSLQGYLASCPTTSQCSRTPEH